MQALQAIWWVLRFEPDDTLSVQRKHVIHIIERWGLEANHHRRSNATNMSFHELQTQGLIVTPGGGLWEVTAKGKAKVIELYGV